MSDINIEHLNTFKVELKFNDIVDKYAEECVDKVRANSRAAVESHRGRYVQGWTTRKEDTNHQYYGVRVWNETDWQLTHLLEYGHLITNKRNGVGWASAHPHIDKAFRSVKNRFIKAMQNVDMKVDIK